MGYFFLRQDLFGDATALEIEGHTELSAQYNWVDGVAFDKPFPRETFTLLGAKGVPYPDFFDTTVPVMSGRLLEALSLAGVTNLETYEVVLRTQRDGVDRTDYRAVNLVGRVDAVDLSKSPHEVRRGKPRFKGPIVIDAQKVAGLFAFRLPHSPRFIVVTESVARHLEPMGFESVLLQPLEEYDGD